MKLATCFLGAAALLSTPVFGNLGKPTLWGSGISSLIDPSLWANTQSPPVTWADWIAFELMPQRCYQEAENLGLNPGDFLAFAVTYNDCGTPWNFCWHTSASISQSSMVDLFGRLPVRERQWIQHVMAVPGGGSAYNSAAVIVFQGPVGVPSVFQHETTHSLDAYAGASGVGQLSETFYWLNSIASDTCVPDDYSNTNEVEDFAQIGVVCLFNAVNPGGMDAAFGTSSWHCLLNQFNYWNTVLYPSYIEGDVCARRWADSPAVFKSTGALNKRSEEVLPRRDEGQPTPFFSGITQYNVSALHVDEGARAAAKAKQDVWAKEAAQKEKLAKRSARFAKL